MAVKIAPSMRQQFENANGEPYVGGKLFTYAAGSSTKQSTFTDSTGLTSNANPIILDSAGRTPFGLWLTAGLNYKFVLAPATDTDPPSSPVFTEDVVSGVNDTTTTTSQWIASAATPTYISATQFTLVGDKTADFHVGRRLKFTVTAGTVYGLITVTAYTTLTTVTVVMDSGALDTGLSAVELSILTNTGSALPARLRILTDLTAQQATDLAAVSTFMGTVLNDADAATARITLGVKTKQVVHLDTGALATGTTILPFDDTIPQNTEGTEFMSLAITPKSATSSLLVEVVWNGTGSLAAENLSAALFRDAVAGAIGAAGVVETGDRIHQIIFSAKAASGSTALTTFKVRAGLASAGTTTFNGVVGARRFGGVMSSSIRITEIED